MSGQRKPRTSRQRKAALGGLSGLLAACVAVAQADALPVWVRASAGVLGVLVIVLGIAVLWPQIRALFPDGEQW